MQRYTETEACTFYTVLHRNRQKNEKKPYLRISLFLDLRKCVQQVTCPTTVENVDGRRGKPQVQVVQGQGDVLGVVLVEDPEFPIRSRSRNSMTIVVKEDTLLLYAAGRKTIREFTNLWNKATSACRVLEKRTPDITEKDAVHRC